MKVTYFRYFLPEILEQMNSVTDAIKSEDFIEFK